MSLTTYNVPGKGDRTVYASYEEFLESYGGLNTRLLSNIDNLRSPEINEETVIQALVRATAQINGYLPPDYVMNIDNAERICIALARYELEKDRRSQDTIREYDKETEYLQWLSEELRRRSALGTGGGDTDPTPEEDGADLIGFSSSSGGRVFTDETLSGF